MSVNNCFQSNAVLDLIPKRIILTNLSKKCQIYLNENSSASRVRVVVVIFLADIVNIGDNCCSRDFLTDIV